MNCIRLVQLDIWAVIKPLTPLKDDFTGQECLFRQCSACARCKPGPGLGKDPLQQSLVCFPLDRIGIDIVGLCPITQDGNEYMIVVQDYCTELTEVYPFSNHTALKVAT